MRNPLVMATAAKKAVSMLGKIQQFGITKDMSEDATDALVMDLATAKAIEMNKPVAECVKGQEYYVGMLKDFQGMTPLQRLDNQYNDVFFEVASEEEILALLTDPVVETPEVKVKASRKKKAA